MLSISKVSLFLWDLLIFMMLAFPRIMQIPKFCVILAIIICSLISKYRIIVRKRFFYFVMLWIGYHAYAFIIGLIYGNNIFALLSNIRFNILSFLVLIYIVSYISQIENGLKKTIQTSCICTIYIGLYNIIIVICAYTGQTIPLLLELDATARVGIHIGYSHIVSTNLSMMLLLFPLFLMLSLSKEIINCVGVKLINISIWVSGISMILSGRRILWLVLGLALLYYFFCSSKDKMKLLRNMLLIIVGILSIYLILRQSCIFDINSIINRFISAFVEDENSGGESVRFNQIRDLTTAFLKRPVFGAGTDAELIQYRGKKSNAWSFEMSYNMILFNGGIIGFAMYFCSLFNLGKYIYQLKTINKIIYRGIFAAFLFCIIANGTNPYFSSSFDFLIMLALPLFLTDTIINHQKRNLLCVSSI